jgi:hypothetical protein
MGPTRFERVTSRLSAVRSTWLSYGPDPHFALPTPLITVSLLSPLDLFESGVQIAERATLSSLRRHPHLMFCLIDPAQSMPRLFDRLKSRQERL